MAPATPCGAWIGWNLERKRDAARHELRAWRLTRGRRRRAEHCHRVRNARLLDNLRLRTDQFTRDVSCSYFVLCVVDNGTRRGSVFAFHREKLQRWHRPQTPTSSSLQRCSRAAGKAALVPSHMLGCLSHYRSRFTFHAFSFAASRQSQQSRGYGTSTATRSWQSSARVSRDCKKHPRSCLRPLHQWASLRVIVWDRSSPVPSKCVYTTTSRTMEGSVGWLVADSLRTIRVRRLGMLATAATTTFCTRARKRRATSSRGS